MLINKFKWTAYKCMKSNRIVIQKQVESELFFKVKQLIIKN
jgi:hypothetical protein